MLRPERKEDRTVSTESWRSSPAGVPAPPELPTAPEKLRTVRMASSAPQLQRLLPRGLRPSLWPPLACSLAEITPPSCAPREDGGLRGTQTRDCGGLHGLLTISKQATCFQGPLGHFTLAAPGSDSDVLVFFHIKFRPGRAILPHIFPTLGNSAFSFDNSTGVSGFFFSPSFLVLKVLK